MQNISLSIRNFNDKIKHINQTNSKQLVLTASEARSLHSDIFALLSNIAEMQSTNNVSPNQTPSSLNLDGGTF
jgi:hypothetical protein